VAIELREYSGAAAAALRVWPVCIATEVAYLLEAVVGVVPSIV
jgi:hypothetical protein